MKLMWVCSSSGTQLWMNFARREVRKERERESLRERLSGRTRTMDLGVTVEFLNAYTNHVTMYKSDGGGLVVHVGTNVRNDN